MKYYVDCEFDGHHGPLLSMAIVAEDGDSIHIRTRNFATNPWVIENVMPLMEAHRAQKSVQVAEYEVGRIIRNFIPETITPTIVADSPVDIVRFCDALSTNPEGEWASAEYPYIRCEVHNVDCYPTDLPEAVQHNAWWDAMALRKRLTA